MTQSSTPATMKALIATGSTTRYTTTRPLPTLRPRFLLIRTHAVALNPMDHKSLDGGFRATHNSLIGCDFAGTVEAVGADVAKAWRVGDRVCGTAHGGNATNGEDGAFAEWIVAKGDVCMRVPSFVSLEEAAGMGMCAITSGQAMVQKMGMRLPLDMGAGGEKEFVLVYGGSSNCGTLAIQFAKLAGYTVVTTCSPKNAQLCKSRGAEVVFDYNDPDCGQKIKGYTHGQLRLCFDTIGSDGGIQICMTALSKEPGSKYGTVGFTPIPRKDVIYTTSICMMALGEDMHMWGQLTPALKEDIDFGVMFTGLTEQLLAKGKLQPHPIRKYEKGLAGILDGMEMMRAGKVSGEKLVFVVSETP